MRHGPHRNDAIGFAFLPLIESLNALVVTDGEMRRFGIRPRQVFVATFGVAFPFNFVVANTCALNTPTVRSVITHLLEAFDVTRFQRNGRR